VKQYFVVALLLAPVFASSPSAAQGGPEFSKCLQLDDMTKERLDCYDKLVRPETMQVLQNTAPRTIYDCRYVKEEDARLKCFNRFAAPAAAPARRATPKQ
jgi:hypothetical protein